jgi:hypothetical protein
LAVVAAIEFVECEQALKEPMERTGLKVSQY